MEQSQENCPLPEPAQGCCQTLSTDLEKIRKMQKLTKRNIDDSIDKVIEVLQSTKSNLTNSTSENRKLFEVAHHNLKTLKPLSKVLNSHKSYFKYLSKYGKDVERYFQKEVNNIFRETNFDAVLLDKQKVVSDYLIRSGNYNKLVEDYSQNSVEQRILQANIIHEKIKSRHLEDAIKWIAQQSEQNQQKLDFLKFALLKQGFIDCLEKNVNNPSAPILYAKKHLSPYFQKFPNEVQRLMASVVYFQMTSSKLPVHSNFDYSDLFASSNWEKISQLFLTETLKIQGIPISSCLALCLKSGILALPKFLKYSLLEQGRQDLEQKDDLEIDIDLGNNYKFHSLFVCPVSREVSNPGDPPILLKCGHVISSQSWQRILSTTSLTKNLKCSTCSKQLKINEIQKVYY